MSSSTNLQVAKSFLMKIGSGAPPDDVADDVRRQFRNFQGRTGCGVTQFNPGLNVLRLAGQFGKAKEIEMRSLKRGSPTSNSLFCSQISRVTEKQDWTDRVRIRSGAYSPIPE